MIKKYELICLVSAKIDKIDRDTIIESISKLIKEKGGEVIETGPASEVSLGYPIKKEEKAQLVVLVFGYKNQDLSKLKKEIETEQKIIRCFLREMPIKRTIPLPKRRARREEKVETEEKVKIEDIDKKIEEIFNPKKNELK